MVIVQIIWKSNLVYPLPYQSSGNTRFQEVHSQNQPMIWGKSAVRVTDTKQHHSHIMVQLGLEPVLRPLNPTGGNTIWYPNFFLQNLVIIKN